ncbi:Protein FD [Acorus calamus]|uniref:Protein FD n=1 Tax=Acorus calamus TaxID=4465 RepID=A0AAV9D7W4_ACOCL|nr:Protein FD [Acorus calamus]
MRIGDAQGHPDNPTPNNLPNINIINNNKNRVISTITTSSSSFSSPTITTTTTTSLSRKTMDEVWKDINLSNLHDHHQQQPTMDFRSPMTLQDFLSRPFHIPSSAPRDMGPPPPPQPPPSPPPPHNMLNLKSNMNNFLYMDPLQTSNTGPSAAIANSDVSFEGGDVGSSGGLFSFYKKRLPEQDAISGDRRHKRMIKNRESAARSRLANRHPLMSLCFFLFLAVEVVLEMVSQMISMPLVENMPLVDHSHLLSFT